MFSSVFVVIPVLLPFLQERFGLSLAEVGLALAAINFGMALSLVGWGQRADRVGDRRVMVAGLGGAAIGFAAAAEAPSFALLLAAMTCAGALGAAVNASSTRAVMVWFPPHERGLALGIRQTAIPLGGALFALLLPPIAAGAGTEGGFLLLAAVMAVAALAATQLNAPLGPLPEAQADGRHPLRDGAVWRVALGGGVMLAGQAVLVGFLVLFLHDERHLSTAASAAVLAAAQVIGAGLLIANGRWSDTTRTRLRPLRIIGVGGSLTMLAVAATTGAPLVVTIPVAVAATALSLSWVSLCSAAAGEVAAAGRSGAAMGLQQALMAVSATLTPVAFSALLDASSWPTAFTCVAIAPLLGTLPLRNLREPRISN